MATSLSARISEGPSDLVNEEILLPQFRYEAARLLPWYVRAEKTLVAEYLRMGMISTAQAGQLAAALDQVNEESIAADPRANMSDIAFAIELFVRDRLGEDVPPSWHVDRSRNDLQACAQLLYGRERVLATVETVLRCAEVVSVPARRYVRTLMPGYTHLQAAQVMSPGFYLAGIADHLAHTARRFLAVHDEMDRCPLGAGAMTGQELDWDRARMAGLLGFAEAHPHPLTAVASRTWLLDLAAEGSTFGVVLGRFVTDLMSWGGSAYGFVDLPDSLSGISSAMPQKKNYPILERIRGRAAHLTSHYLDVAMTQRATAFSNSVEVSKEGGTALAQLFDNLGSVLRLLTVVLDNLRFREEEMREVCEHEYLGGFSLANMLTVRAGIPWRMAQVIAGEYIVEARRLGLEPQTTSAALLAGLVITRYGRPENDPDFALMLDQAFDPEQGLLRKQRTGSANPEAVEALLVDQEVEVAGLAAEVAVRRATLARADAELALALRAEPGELCPAEPMPLAAAV